MHFRITLFAILFFLTAGLSAQTVDIPALIARVRLGEGDDVAKLLPQLEKSRPNDAGVLFLRALLETNAEKSVETYQRIADEHPDSEWADDALYRLYQYSYAVGAYRTARTHLDKLSARYPKSPFAQRMADGGKANKNESGKTSGSTNKINPNKDGGSKEAETYSVQIGAYAKLDDANRQVLDLKAKGYTAFVKQKEVEGKQVRAVWLGLFSSFEQAQAFAVKLKKQQNIDAIVVRR